MSDIVASDGGVSQLLTVQETWEVAIRYADNKTECVPVGHVKRFCPQNIDDFEPDKIYKVRSTKWNLRGVEESYLIIIEAIGVSKKGAEAMRKAKINNMDAESRKKILEKLRDASKIPQPNTSSDQGKDVNVLEQEMDARSSARRQATQQQAEEIVNRLGKRPDVVDYHEGSSSNSSSGSEPEKSSPKGSSSKRIKRPRRTNPSKKGKKRQIEDPAEVIRMREMRALQERTRAQAAQDWSAWQIGGTSSPLRELTFNNVGSTSTPIVRTSVATVSSPDPSNPIRSEPLAKPPISFCSQTGAGSSGPQPNPVKTTSSHPTLSNTSPIVGNSSSAGTSGQLTSPISIPIQNPLKSLFKDALPQRVSAVEKSVESLETRLSVLETTVGTKFTSLESKIETRLQSLESKVEEVLRILKTGSVSAPQPLLHGKEVIDGRVQLSAKFSCQDICWKVMNTCDTEPDWYSSILRGVFGEEEARIYRLAPRCENFKTFDKDFLILANAFFTEFLNRRTQEYKCQMERRPDDLLLKSKLDCIEANFSLFVAQLGANLSDSSHRMYMAWEKLQTSLGLPVPLKVKKVREKKINVKKTSSSKKLIRIPKSLTQQVRSKPVKKSENGAKEIQEDPAGKHTEENSLEITANSPSSTLSDGLESSILTNNSQLIPVSDSSTDDLSKTLGIGKNQNETCLTFDKL